MKRFLHFWRDCRGNGIPFLFIGLSFVLILLVMVAMELGGVYQRYFVADAILQRACNSALESNLVDDMRADHILFLDVTQAESDFTDFVTADLPDGFSVTVSNFDTTEKPPVLFIEGTVTMPSLFAQSFLPEITFDFAVHSTNYDLDDDAEEPAYVDPSP